MTNSPKVWRLVDANLNRLREGLRVVEDIYRYIYDDLSIATQIKELRHQIRIKNEKELLRHRDILGDVLKRSTHSEFERATINSVITANLKRAQESARVLEECLKLVDPKEAQRFKEIRYRLYQMESSLYDQAKTTSNSK